MSKTVNECDMYSRIISDYVDGELSRSETMLLIGHIEQCSSCGCKLQNITKIKDMVRVTYNVNTPPIDLSKTIMANIKRNEATKAMKRNRRSTLPKFMRVTAVAVAMIFVVCATILYSQVESKKMLAQKDRFDSYAIEHSSLAVYDEPMVQPANYSHIFNDR